MDWESFYNNFRTPDFIAGYEIQNRLGGGAFGDVYKARKQSIGKPYAIKFLKIEDDSQREAVERGEDLRTGLGVVQAELGLRVDAPTQVARLGLLGLAQLTGALGEGVDVEGQQPLSRLRVPDGAAAAHGHVTAVGPDAHARQRALRAQLAAQLL